MKIEKSFRYEGKEKFKISEWKTDETLGYKDGKESKKLLGKDVKKIERLQEKLYASDKHSVLIIFQAMDAAGKDGTIKHVMSGINPQGCQVTCFKSPSSEELDHDFLWRINKQLPERGRIGIFNRSYYEEVLVTKVHPEYIVGERLPGINSVKDITKDFWENRYSHLRAYESYLSDNGYIIIKFFLHLSKDEQKARFLCRIDEPEKNWKFSEADLKERERWDEYQEAFQAAIQHTATEINPWYIIPADNKWFMRMSVSGIIAERMSRLNLKYPDVSEERRVELKNIRKRLIQE